MIHRDAWLEKDHTSEVVSARDCVEHPGRSSERGGTWAAACGFRGIARSTRGREEQIAW